MGSADPTCAHFAVINGTYQLVSIAAAFGADDPTGLARVELAAAPSVDTAAGELFRTWPAELSAERTVAEDDLVGPIARRAERALQVLDEAGAGEADLAALTAAWTTVLEAQERDNPEVVLPALPPATDDVLAAAAEQFASDVTSYSADPSLLRIGVETPLTDAWLGDRCPEVLAGSGTDAV